MGSLGYWGVLEAEREGFYLSIIHLIHVLLKQRKGVIYICAIHTHALMIPHQNNKKTIDQDQRGCEKWKEKDQKQFYTDRLYLLVRHVSGRLLRLVLLPITHNGDCAIVKDTAPAPSYPSSPATLPRPGASWVPLTLSSTNAFAGVWSIPLRSGRAFYQYMYKNSTRSFQPLRTTLMRCI